MTTPTPSNAGAPTGAPRRAGRLALALGTVARLTIAGAAALTVLAAAAPAERSGFDVRPPATAPAVAVCWADMACWMVTP